MKKHTGDTSQHSIFIPRCRSLHFPIDIFSRFCYLSFKFFYIRAHISHSKLDMRALSSVFNFLSLSLSTTLFLVCLGDYLVGYACADPAHRAYKKYLLFWNWTAVPKRSVPYEWGTIAERIIKKERIRDSPSAAAAITNILAAVCVCVPFGCHNHIGKRRKCIRVAVERMNFFFLCKDYPDQHIAIP